MGMHWLEYGIGFIGKNTFDATVQVNYQSRGGSRIGTVELQHPLFPLDIIDNI
jgi:hypothetical protein